MSVVLAAEYFSISPASLRGMSIETVRVGRRVLYDRRALDAYADRLSGLSDHDATIGAHLSPQEKREAAMADEERRFFERRTSR